MTDEKSDFVIEAVRYQPDGWIDFVRLYERRGASFSDIVLCDREKVLHLLKTHKVIHTGVRLSGLASTFRLDSLVKMDESANKMVLYNTDEIPNIDLLLNVPVL